MKEGGMMDISLEMACIADLKRLEIIGYSALGHLKMIYTLITGDKILIYTDGRKTKRRIKKCDT